MCQLDHLIVEIYIVFGSEGVTIKRRFLYIKKKFNSFLKSDVRCERFTLEQINCDQFTFCKNPD